MNPGTPCADWRCAEQRPRAGAAAAADDSAVALSEHALPSGCARAVMWYVVCGPKLGRHDTLVPTGSSCFRLSRLQKQLPVVAPAFDPDVFSKQKIESACHGFVICCFQSSMAIATSTSAQIPYPPSILPTILSKVSATVLHVAAHVKPPITKQIRSDPCDAYAAPRM